MFYNLKTKIYFIRNNIVKHNFNKRNKIVLLIIVATILIITLSRILYSKNTSEKVEIPVLVENVNEMELDSEEVKNKDVVFGSDIKIKYKEVKDSDFAILITTIDLLKEKEKEEEWTEYYRYALESGDNNIISTIQIIDDVYLDAVFLNYNRLLKDTVVMKDISGGYIAPYGFTEEEGRKFNKYIENKAIEFNDDTVFEEYPIYDGNYKLLGNLYIESFNNY